MAGRRLTSGHGPLDEILGGGLPANGITVIMGQPGTGKTILAQQYTFQNASPQRPVVYFSDLVRADGEDHQVRADPRFLRSLRGRHLGVLRGPRAGHRPGRAGRGNDSGFTATLKDRRPGLVIIDGFKTLRVFAESDAAYRRFLHQLAGRLTAFPAAALWVGIYEAADVPLLPEFAAADAILDLRTARTGQRDMRLLEVRKLRGSGFRSGQHAYRLDHAGLHLFPRLADAPAESGYQMTGERVPFGVPALDSMLAGGLWPGASTMITGPAGSGKTVLGLHFIQAGIPRGEPGVIATLQENPSQLTRMLTGLGWPADDPSVEVVYRSAVDIYIDEWVYEVLDTVERTGARRVLLDSLIDLQTAAPDETRFREFMYSLTQRLARQGINLVMTCEVPELFGARSLSNFAASHLSDNVIMLNFYTDQGLI